MFEGQLARAGALVEQPCAQDLGGGCFRAAHHHKAQGRFARMPLFIFCGKFLGEVLTENLRLLRPVEKSAVTSSELGSLSGSLRGDAVNNFVYSSAFHEGDISLEP